ncbi:MAG: hypothetical protein JOZ54_12370 [Acidobacteria bacterium]|nr:hypothetical protein [Acidobacteriota bacterium]
MTVKEMNVEQLIQVAPDAIAIEGLRPVGSDLVLKGKGVDPATIPQKLDELGELESYTYDLTVRQAGELNIPIIGSVSGGTNRRVVVYEWSRFKEVPGDDGTIYRYGYAIRFCLTVSNFDLKGKLSLSFLSAQAEIGMIQASWLMQVRGLAGPKIDEVVLPPQDLDVKTFVIAQQSLKAAIAAANDASTKFVSGIVVAKKDPLSAESQYRAAAVATFALSAIQRGRKKADCISRLGSSESADLDVVDEVYTFLAVGATDPTNAAKHQAREILGGIRTDD